MMDRDELQVQKSGLSQSRLKKAPDAPRRFKSAYIFFSAEKHKEMKDRLGDKAKTTDVARELAEEWKKLGPEDREKWEEMSRRDKMRYEMERDTYAGPWKVHAPKRSRKDPSAPKRPPSAFFDFSNSKRAGIKRQNPDADNGTISRILAQMWREAPEDVRIKHIEKEQLLREEYKVAIAEWREKDEQKKEKQRQQREERAFENVERAKSLAIQESYTSTAPDYAILPHSLPHAARLSGFMAVQAQNGGLPAASFSGGMYPGQFGSGYPRQNNFLAAEAMGMSSPIDQLLLARQLEEQRSAQHQLQESMLIQQMLQQQHEADQIRNMQQQVPQSSLFASHFGYMGRGAMYNSPSLRQQFHGSGAPAVEHMQYPAARDVSGLSYTGGTGPGFGFPPANIPQAAPMVSRSEPAGQRTTDKEAGDQLKNQEAGLSESNASTKPSAEEND